MARGSYGSSPEAPGIDEAAVAREVQGSVQGAVPARAFRRAARVLEAWIVIAVGVLCVMAATGVFFGFAPTSLQLARSMGGGVSSGGLEHPLGRIFGSHDQDWDVSGPERNSTSDWLQTKNNLTKIAWAASDTDAAKKFFLRYSSSMAALDGCDPSCECGTQGRVMLNGSSGFGLHSVDAFTHPTGAINVSGIEKVFTLKVGDASTYVDVMDHHAGLWAPDLDGVVV